MASLITPEALEREHIKHRYEGGGELHKQPYGVSGWRWVRDVRKLAELVGASDVLDYGAGKMTLERDLSEHLPTHSYDPVTAPTPPEPADIVVCTDVLEHIEPDSLDTVLADIKRLANKAVHIAVPKHPPEKGDQYLTIEELSWWEDRLAKHWPNYEKTILEAGTPRLVFTGFSE